MRLRNWRLKAFAQQAFSTVPRGHALNYLFQRRVFRNLPISDDSLSDTIALGWHHVTTLERAMHRPLADCRFYEFGAGWDLAMPLVLYSFGVEHQTVVDIRRLVRQDLVFDVASRLHETPHMSVRVPPLPTGALESYLEMLGIHYRAPCDARSTGLPAGSVDCITSTNTLEHIPPDDIHMILRECHRLLAPDGRMSFQVDHRDHYAYFDPTIDQLHFLRYSERAWRVYNPSLHFQNRLRRSEVTDLYVRAGFVIDNDQRTVIDGGETLLASTPMAQRFASMTPADLMTATSRTLLRARS